MAIRRDGTLWAWGSQLDGRLGNNVTTGNQTTPLQIGTDTWVQVSAGSTHTMAIRRDGTLWAWGGQLNGRLGNGETSGNQPTPVQIGDDRNWALVSAGNTHTVAIRTDGTLWAWGSPADGRLGNGSTSGDQSSPVQIGTDTNWAQVAASEQHNLAIRRDGTLWAWGRNEFGQTGQTFEGAPQAATNNSSPVQVGSNTNWEFIAAGSVGTNHSIAVRSDGTIWVWGNNARGQVGDGSVFSSHSPMRLGTENWQHISASLQASAHNVAVRADGSLWTWGANFNNRLGDGTLYERWSPVQIQPPANWKQISAGDNHTVAIRTNGELWAWGLNTNGQLGNDSTIAETTPVRIGTRTDWAQVSAGGTHTVAICTDGKLWAWGNQANGRLGNGQTAAGNQTTPLQIKIQIDNIEVETGWKYVSVGLTHTMAIRTDGSLWAWGEGGGGRLGLGDTNNRSIPTRIGTDNNWEYVSAGSAHTMAIRSNGELWAWGLQGNGRLGNDVTTGNQTTPIQIGTDTNWAQVSAGETHTLAIREDGSLWAWGNQVNGRLGNNEISGNQLTPVEIGSDTDWTQISASQSHSVALRTGGSLWIWGNHANGRLGIGPHWRDTPVQVLLQ